MMKMNRLKWMIIGFFLFTCAGYAQKRAALINDHVAVFYPDDFNVKENLPSFALVKEPVEQGPLPDTWKVKAEFSEAFGKSMAFVKTDLKTDLYGTGESTGPLLKNSSTHMLWNTDNPEYSKDHNHRLYQTQPWVLGVRPDGTAFGVLADNTWKQEISLGQGIQFSSDGPPFRVFVIEGNTPQEVLKRLADLTGKMKLPPLWSLGYQQCRWSYYPDTRVKEIADTFRIKQIPCDVIWLDIHYMDGYKIFTFSPDRFPNPKETNEYLHNKGFKSVWMIDPGVKKEAGYFVYDSGTKKDVWVKDADGQNYVGKVWPGDCVFPDFTMERTQAWWSSLYKNYMANGIDGVWNDMNEPAVFEGPDWTMPVNNIHRGDNEHPKDVHLRYHNVYGMMMVKATREGILETNPDKRPFVLTRANYIGGQRYAATWTGDNTSCWAHLRMSIPMSLNLGLSGQPFNGPDIGGFNGNATPELFGQWIATGAFYPFCRAHTIQGSKNHEPWAFGKKIENVSRTALQRRYCLMPYLYTLFHEASVDGMPVMRPVFFADLHDLNLRQEDQLFLLGADLLVVPKWADLPRLPKGIWRTIDLIGENSEKSRYQPDLKQRGGTIIPVGKIIQSTTEYSTDSLTLLVCLNDEMKAEGTLYNDAGNGFEYQKGQYAIDSFSAQKTGNHEVTVTCTKKEGEMPETYRYYRIGLVTDSGIVYSDWKNKTRIVVNLPGK
jgi:alpha-glucosidase